VPLQPRLDKEFDGWDITSKMEMHSLTHLPSIVDRASQLIEVGDKEADTDTVPAIVDRDFQLLKVGDRLADTATINCGQGTLAR
jgi:hypothetical protein